MWPHLVIYTDDLGADFGGTAKGFVIRIRPKYRGDQGLLRHELEHVRQWWVSSLVTAALLCAPVIGFDLHPSWLFPAVVWSALPHRLAYLLSRRYRLWAEVRAYRVQMRYPDATGGSLSASRAAQFLIQPKYRLGLDYPAALALFS